MAASAPTTFRTYLGITVTTNAATNSVENLLTLINAALATANEIGITGAWREILIQNDPDNVPGGGGALGNVLIGDSKVKNSTLRCGYKLKIGDNKAYRDITNTIGLGNLSVSCDTASFKLNIELVA